MINFPNSSSLETPNTCWRLFSRDAVVVFKVSVDTKKWIKAAVVRAVKTVAQTAGGMITVGAAISEVDWGYIASVSIVAGVISIITSVAGIPEVQEE